MANKPATIVRCVECLDWLQNEKHRFQSVDMTFLDPPFNQGKRYRRHDDSLDEQEYWSFMTQICDEVYRHTQEGGCIYFMQREKNTDRVLMALRETGWVFQNLIVWKKLTSAVPSPMRYGKAFQIICFATKGKRPSAFNRLRISPKLPIGYRPHRDGVFVTDVWDDIRELTSGYFAGEEALRDKNGSRKHKQQSPIALLLRMVLSSTMPGMTVFDPFAGSGTTAVVAEQLRRNSILLEIDPKNFELIQARLQQRRESDSLSAIRQYYQHTPNLGEIWPTADVSDRSEAA